MNTIGDWAKLLVTYGPPAFVLLLIYVVAGNLKAALKAASAHDKPWIRPLYVLNWLVIFGLVIFSTVAWARGNLLPAGCQARLLTVEGDVRKSDGGVPDDIVVRQHPPQQFAPVDRDGHFILQGIPLGRGEVMPTLDFESKNDDYASTLGYELNADNANQVASQALIKLTKSVTVRKKAREAAPVAAVGGGK